ncbi:MAG: GNAT family N-acetyltransferase [Burkholderiaceae bacterium]
MNGVELRVVERFPEPAFAAFQREVFANDVPSQLLTEVLAGEAAARQGKAAPQEEGALRIGAYRGDALMGWTYGCRQLGRNFYMINSGVALSERRRGIYSLLVQQVIDHAHAQGYVSITSRHVASNAAVIIAKLKLGFVVSGFEYSEVYGPLVRLTYFVGEPRRKLYQTRAGSIRRIEPDTH